jgi:hypothetical protein
VLSQTSVISEKPDRFVSWCAGLVTTMISVLVDKKGPTAQSPYQTTVPKGSFVLLHRGIMTGGGQELMLTVVPDSASDELAGRQDGHQSRGR